MLGNYLGSILGKVLLPRPLLVPERMRCGSRTVAVLYRCSVRAWLKLTQNHIYVVPQNQGMTMNANAESKAAPKVINGRIKGRFASGHSGNPGGSPEATRRAFNKRFLLDLAEDWQQHGREVFKRVRRESPAAYLKVCAMLVPKEMKIEHSGGIKAMTDEQIMAAIEAIETWMARQSSEAAKVIEGEAEVVPSLRAPARPTKAS
jgi:hypothetical protein